MDLEKLVAYDQWANNLVFEAFQMLDKEEGRVKIEKLFSHILASQIIWMDRITGDTSAIDIWPDLSKSEIKSYLETNSDKLSKLLLLKDEHISYQNSSGETFTNKVEDIFVHLIIHGQHHRAQIAKLIRQAGDKPPATDFIFFQRQKHNSRRA